MSKWEEVANNELVGAPKHSLAELKKHLALERVKPIKAVKEDKHKKSEMKKRDKHSEAKRKQTETGN